MPAKLRIVAGTTFGHLTVIREVAPGRQGRRFLCLCDCGNECVGFLAKLRRGNKTGCGCRRTAGLSTLRHGCARASGNTPEYTAWMAMHQRCNPNNQNKKFYAERGITVCERWSVFETFLADVGPKPSPRHSLDRYPNNDGNYEPGNVRWAVPAQQARNQRSNIHLEFRGQTHLLVEWAEITGITVNALRQRLKLGWDVERMLTQPQRYSPPRKNRQEGAGQLPLEDVW